jgi:hypothetical protein
LNTSTTPWSVDSSGGGYFVLLNGTIVGNGTGSCSCKINLNSSSSSAHGIIGAAYQNTGTCRNSLYYTVSGTTYTFGSDWGAGNNNTLTITNPNPSNPLVLTLITYLQGSTQGTYNVGGTGTTTYTQLIYLNKTTTSFVNRDGWSFGSGNDQMMGTPFGGSSGAFLKSQMFYCINSSYAITDSDKDIMENS